MSQQIQPQPKSYSIPQYCAPIPAISPNEPRPLWSVMISTHNQAAYLGQAISSVLEQAPGEDTMQIVVVDDCSTQPGIPELVQRIGGTRVQFFQQPKNVGHIQNFTTCLTQAKGHWIHLLHGDDCVRPGFYARMQALLQRPEKPGAAFCRSIIMDQDGHWQSIEPLEQRENGILQDWLSRIAVYNHIRTPAMVVCREVYETLGSFDARLSYTEDWEMWVRIAAHYPVAYEVEPLALYRKHSASSTTRHQKKGENLKDLKRAIQAIQQHLPTDARARLAKRALQHQVSGTLYDAKVCLDQGDAQAALCQIREALRCCTFSLEIVAKLLILFIKLVFFRIKKNDK